MVVSNQATNHRLGKEMTGLAREQPITSPQLAQHLQVSSRTLVSWRKAGRIPFWKINARNFRYRISEVEAALAR